jgi:hypothetical protein
VHRTMSRTPYRHVTVATSEVAATRP